jgi:hypothetical protein
MRKVFALAALTATCVAAVFAVAAAAAPAAESGRVIRFIEVDNERADRFVDADHNNRASLGDSFAGSLKLYAWAEGGGRGKRIGHAEILCTFASANSAFCQGAFFLPGGRIEGQGYTKLAGTVKVVVTGGTGAYAGARGTFTSRQIRDTRDAYGNFVSVSADVIRLLP